MIYYSFYQETKKSFSIKFPKGVFDIEGFLSSGHAGSNGRIARRGSLQDDY